MSDHSSPFLLITILVLATVILVSAMRYYSMTRTARLAGSGDRDDKALTADIAEIKARLGTIEKILREVE